MKIHAKIPCVYFKHNYFEIPNDQGNPNTIPPQQNMSFENSTHIPTIA